MSSGSTRWYLAASWMSLVLLVFIAADGSSAGSLLLLAVAGFVPPAAMMSLWKEPSLSVADVLRAVEVRR